MKDDPNFQENVFWAPAVHLPPAGAAAAGAGADAEAAGEGGRRRGGGGARAQAPPPRRRRRRVRGWATAELSARCIAAALMWSVPFYFVFVAILGFA